MTLVDPGLPSSAIVAPKSRIRPRVRLAHMLIATGGALFVLSLVRYITSADDLTSSGAFEQAWKSSIPILLAGLGGLYSERAGVVNIGLEGMMIFGTWFGAWGGYRFGPWWGVLLGVLGGAVGGLIHALATGQVGVNHIVSGVAINILAPGVPRFLASEVFTPAGGSAAQSPTVDGNTGHFTLPMLSGGKLGAWHSPDVLGWFEAKHWFLISD